jgi:DNA repair protein RadA/Sms
VRPVGQTETRLKEARKLGFARAILAEGSKTEGSRAGAAGEEPVQAIPDLPTLAGDIFGAG